MTRTRRTYVVAAAVAAIVTAANASQGGYFSQSWGWVALAFLVPTTVLLILDRVETPGRLRVASLMVALGVWIALSSLWSISASASIREVVLVALVALGFVARHAARRTGSLDSVRVRARHAPRAGSRWTRTTKRTESIGAEAQPEPPRRGLPGE